MPCANSNRKNIRDYWKGYGEGKMLEASCPSLTLTWVGWNWKQNVSWHLQEVRIISPRGQYRCQKEMQSAWMAHSCGWIMQHAWGELWDEAGPSKCRNSSGRWHCCLAQKQNNRWQSDWWLFERPLLPLSLFWHVSSLTWRRKIKRGVSGWSCTVLGSCLQAGFCLPALSSCMVSIPPVVLETV